jgi:transcriptional regulator with XRE-family HTH domain
MNVLKRLRAEKGFTLRGLAAASGVNVNTIQYLETEKTNAMIGTIAKLSKALEVDITVLEPLMTQVDNSPKNEAVSEKEAA